MEQDLMDFDEWIQLPQNQNIEYFVTFKEDGSLGGVYPSHAVDHNKPKLKIDNEIAQAIANGIENLFSYKVDIATQTLLKVNKFSTHNLIKIDDVLHRIADRKWSTITDPDIVVTHDRNKDALEFSMNERYSTNTIWDGDTAMSFLITEYNDPNALLSIISVRAGDITAHAKSFDIKLPARFSIYTRRIFDKYVFETL